MEKHDEKHYEGWSNYETWTIGVWLNNDEPSLRYWREKIGEHREEVGESFRVREGQWKEGEALQANLADQLMYEIIDAAPITEGTMYADLLSAALSEVNWSEIVDNWLKE